MIKHRVVFGRRYDRQITSHLNNRLSDRLYMYALPLQARHTPLYVRILARSDRSTVNRGISVFLPVSVL
ncbi:hypothetical protein CCR75_002845 [Bremia lactucae]|uniref:Uncharacterized protein n=1 Tax=Bremia lactucae TaxID=4779 RepID=A0A976FJ02_BRELC|nr:hypothetical protein CCR75_002845 [Bremia lactucae]